MKIKEGLEQEYQDYEKLNATDSYSNGVVTFSKRWAELMETELAKTKQLSKEVADQLFISIKTVGTHKQHILKKLNLKTNADMVKFAIKQGLISL